MPSLGTKTMYHTRLYTSQAPNSPSTSLDNHQTIRSSSRAYVCAYFIKAMGSSSGWARSCSLLKVITPPFTVQFACRSDDSCSAGGPGHEITHAVHVELYCQWCAPCCSSKAEGES